jgi:Zinc dependent phospholipase C
MIPNLARKKTKTFRLRAAAWIVIFVFGSVSVCQGYSVLTHEAIIDSAWDEGIKPLLLQRFPGATREDLKTAHSYAYGGCVIQDLGYYPFGSHLFSDLLHYIRTGDFVQALIRDSQDLNEYAFALGALAHYAADNQGHRVAVNLAVPMLYPKLRAKYGDTIVYDQDPAAHLKTEFGFDVLEVAKGRYAPDDYRGFIGFQVSKPLLEKAFQETYSLELKSVFSDFDLSVGTYRYSVSKAIPTATKVAWDTNKDQIQKDIPGVTKEKFLYHISRSSYEKNWGRKYQKPGFKVELLAFLFRLVPKIGPFSVFRFKTPTPAAEKLFEASFNGSVTDYQRFLREQKDSGHIELVNDNFDTGTVTGPGQYPLADKTYAQLLDNLAKDHFAQLSPELRKTLLDFYADPNAPDTTKKDEKEWSKVLKEVDELKALTPNSAPATTSAAATGSN